jgi:type II secretory pathway predicted ATPase ExeA
VVSKVHRTKLEVFAVLSLVISILIRPDIWQIHNLPPDISTKACWNGWAVKLNSIGGDAKRQLHREIEIMRAIHNLQSVVIMDEAHLLDKEMLEGVRFLLNFKMDAESPMTLILVGQSEFWDKLQLQAYASIRQRIDLQCKLPHLDPR